MPTLPALIRAARVGLDMSQKKLAEEAGVHPNTVSRIEQNRPVIYDYLVACQTALERHGLEFIELGGRTGLILPKIDAIAAMRCRVARAALDLSREELAVLAKLNPRTVLHLEAGRAVNQLTERGVNGALRNLGIDMFETEHGSVVMLPPSDQLALILGSQLEPGAPEAN